MEVAKSSSSVESNEFTSSVAEIWRTAALSEPQRFCHPLSVMRFPGNRVWAASIVGENPIAEPSNEPGMLNDTVGVKKSFARLLFRFVISSGEPIICTDPPLSFDLDVDEAVKKMKKHRDEYFYKVHVGFIQDASAAQLKRALLSQYCIALHQGVFPIRDATLVLQYHSKDQNLVNHFRTPSASYVTWLRNLLLLLTVITS
ncbi:hypothetical protein KIN20_024389 [Parelaphostrongylus tenuis]|uniref:Uncharacterized protein n=1 Tax=Parelaphostrongylus tenuis TaxID=148309 RepID=A0AAD5QWQ0_PARTN|nr:hypothetical protein KIN20_024389 [Parelaphostrongylus tenuis]